MQEAAGQDEHPGSRLRLRRSVPRVASPDAADSPQRRDGDGHRGFYFVLSARPGNKFRSFHAEPGIGLPGCFGSAPESKKINAGETACFHNFLLSPESRLRTALFFYAFSMFQRKAEES